MPPLSDFPEWGITSAQPFKKEAAHLETWLQGGHHGEMDYLSADPARRSDPQLILPSAQSVIALAMNYYNEPSPHAARPSPLQGEGSSSPLVKERGWGVRIRPYAPRNAGARGWLRLGQRLSQDPPQTTRLVVAQALSPEVECRTMVDTGPFLERAAAQRAGLGFVEKIPWSSPKAWARGYF